MEKKTAFIVRDNHEEALRVAVGLTLAEGTLEVYCMGREFELVSDVRLYLDTLKEMGIRIVGSAHGYETEADIAIDELSSRLLEYDHVVFY